MGSKLSLCVSWFSGERVSSDSRLPTDWSRPGMKSRFFIAETTSEICQRACALFMAIEIDSISPPMIFGGFVLKSWLTALHLHSHKRRHSWRCSAVLPSGSWF